MGTKTQTLTGTEGGNAISTGTIQRIPIAQHGKLIGPGTMVIVGRNYSTAVVLQVQVNPRLTILVTTDGLVANLSDISDAMQDGDATTQVELDSLPAVENRGFIYVCSAKPIGGLDVDVDAVNATASVMTVRYWNGSTWVDLSDTDGTASGGATFAQDGEITWTTLAAHVKTNLFLSGDALLSNWQDSHVNKRLLNRFGYWYRIEVSVALDSDTIVDQILAMADSREVPAELVVDQPYEYPGIHCDWDGDGCVDLDVNAGTGNAIVTLSGEFADR